MPVNINHQPLANKWNVCTLVQTIAAPTLREHLAAAEVSENDYQNLLIQFADRRAAARLRIAR
jgi:hypothetical protein|tara:strand:- start:197 stop:385 length:189 start_codon:yes stop_codon:yes gene_type:complete